MSFRGANVFTFTWSINHFSMCPQKCQEPIESPVFSVDMLRKTSWRLHLYPRGNKVENIISCYLHCCDSGRNSGEITIGFTLTVVSVKTNVMQKEKKHKFIKNFDWGWDNFIARDEVCTHKDEFLPNDTFTIKCNMWRIDNNEESETDVLDTNSLTECICRTDLFKEMITEIPIKKRIFYWSIRKFSSLQIDRRLSVPFSSCLDKVPSFHITFYLSGTTSEDQCAQIEIQRKDPDCSVQHFVISKISLLHTQDKAQYYTENEHLFKSNVTDDVWKFPLNIKFSNLKKEQYLKATRDVLYFRFEIAFSQLGEVCHSQEVDFSANVEDEQSVSLCSISDPTKNQFKDFYEDGEFSDVTLRCETDDKIFKVHKIILSAKSPVFRGMFRHEMKEKETGVVDIPDVSADTMKRMLDFLYTETLEDLTPNDAIELYIAADKYQILPLKFQCSCVLKSMLSVSNVCKVLMLADAHSDEDLKYSVHNFIHLNLRIIFHSAEWKDLMKSNAILAADVMYKMLMNNLE